MNKDKPEYNIVKGTRVKARFLKANNPLSSLAGMQPKVGCQQVEIEGRVEHIRGDAPVNPTSIGLWIRTDDGQEHIVDSKYVYEIVLPN